MKRLLILLVVLQMFFALSVYSATLDIRGGILFGATDVLVNGVLYDVDFRDGTLIELYNGADENADFPFAAPGELNASSDLAYAASQALHDQVFIGVYDTQPTLINGIHATSAVSQASVITPFWIMNPDTIGVKTAINAPDGIYSYDRILNTGIAPDFDTAWWVKDPNINDEYDATVIAVWSFAEPVPIPSAITLLGFGLLGLAGVSRRKK